MTSRWSLNKALLSSLIGALALSALVGIYILVVGDFGETEKRILWTTLSLTGFSVTALGCTVVLHRRRTLWLAAPGLVASGFGFAWSLPMIWAEWHSEPVFKTMVVLIIFAFSFAQSCLLALAPLRQRLAWAFVAGLVCIFALAVLLSTILIFEPKDDLLARMAGVLGILDACATLAVPILYWFGAKAPVDAGRAPDKPQDQPWRVELCCPRCGHRDVHTVGEIRCPSCSLGIRVTICDEANPGQVS